MTFLKEASLIFAMLTLGFLNVNGQNGSIFGRVVDSKTGENLIGVEVYLEGTNTKTSTDLDGQYSLSNLNPGTYKITTRYVSFKLKLTENVVVNANEITRLNVALDENTNELTEVIMSSASIKESSNGIILE